MKGKTMMKVGLILLGIILAITFSMAAISPDFRVASSISTMPPGLDMMATTMVVGVWASVALIFLGFALWGCEIFTEAFDKLHRGEGG